MNNSILFRFIISTPLAAGMLWAFTEVSFSAGLPLAATKHWTADNGNGTYSNPLFYGEFEDPDPIRVGEDYYLAGTTMHMMPSVEILHSRDLVNWELKGHIFPTKPEWREYLWPWHLGAVHSLSQSHVLCPVQRQWRWTSGLSFKINRWSMGAQPTSRKT